jgi:hypothetical protein
MSTLTITSPGVQINEVDLSLIARPIGSTDILITGFANQGPTEEFTNITSISEFEQAFGAPTNAAERYLYHSAKQVLNSSPGNLIISRLPYGANLGDGYANSYSALVYPISTDSTTYATASNYRLMPPVSLLITDDQYNVILQNNIEWSESPYTLSSVTIPQASYNQFLTDNNIYSQDKSVETYNSTASTYDLSFYTKTVTSSTYNAQTSSYDVSFGYNFRAVTNFDSASGGGLVIINKAKTSINNLYEGYYIGICDNTDVNPSTNFKSVTGIKTVTSRNGTDTQNFTNINPNRLNFALSANYASFGRNSLSEILETYPTGYEFSSNVFDDSIILVLFKLRTSLYNQDTIVLDYVVTEGHAGSLYKNRTQNSQQGGRPITFFIDQVVGKGSDNILTITNPYISQTGRWTNDDATPAKKIRVSDAAKNVYSSGVYLSETDKNSKDVGNIPAKLDRVLNVLQRNDELNVDVVAEAGLGTIWASAKARSIQFPNEPTVFDDTYTVNIGLPPSEGVPGTYLYDNQGNNTYNDGAGVDYLTIANKFVSLANDSRRDHVFIADPLRNIFVQGANQKITNSKYYVFSDYTYWPIKNQFASIQSSYVVTYGNWILVNDDAADLKVWVPSSGYAAAKIAQSAQQSHPWSAVAGFTRGTLTNVLDIAINPTQKQRDLLYKINVNPIAFFPNDGYVIYGQKTLYRKPSAFDRLNVRRLFLVLEKETQALLKYFVFEPNNFSTRQRLIGALSPIFDNAKVNDGLYDYTIVCDERNNTPAVIDNNELRVSIYIQPVRTAEFILADFIATRTGVNFSEIIG